MKELFDQAQLAVTPDEGRLESGGLERSAHARDDAQCPPKRGQPLLTLELECARIVVGDRLLCRSARRLADVDGARLGDRLHPRRRVDQVAGDHALTLRPEGDCGLPGEDTCPGAQFRLTDLVAEGGDGGDEVERGAHRAFRVVLRGRGCAPDRHHGVADELLDGAAVELDEAAARVEVAREQLARLLGVT